MDAIRYCTPEWLEESARRYRSTRTFEERLAKVTSKICFRILAEPAWGIDQDMIFGAVVEQGVLHELTFYREADARALADHILVATPQDWKKLLRKETKFVTDVMLGRITIEQGSRVGVLKLAPYADAFVDALTQFALQFPDEMTPEEREGYRRDLGALRERLEG